MTEKHSICFQVYTESKLHFEDNLLFSPGSNPHKYELTLDRYMNQNKYPIYADIIIHT